jgi:Amt family ammonium transporter
MDAVLPLACFETQVSAGAESDESPMWELLEALPCMAFIERDGELVAVNPLAREGAGTRESVPVDRFFAEGYPIAGDESRQRFEGLLRRSDGRSIQVSGAVQPFAAAGVAVRLVLLIEAVEGASSGNGPAGQGTYLQDLFDSSTEAMIIVENFRVRHANREFLRMFGYSLAECVGADTHDLIIPEGRDHEAEMLLHTVAAEGRASMETVRHTSTGEELDVSLSIARVRLGANAMGLCITFRDIGPQKQNEARLQYAALHDPLTGLANRVLFLDRVTLTMARLKRRPDRNFAVVFLDVDRFKQVNDTYGHAAGDALLLAVTARLCSAVRPQDTIARFGGDEFALLLDEVGSAEEIARLAERIQRELQGAVDVGGKEVFVSASMGIAISSLAYLSADEIMHDADMAMYAAKAAGKARHEFSHGRALPKADGPNEDSQAEMTDARWATPWG